MKAEMEGGKKETGNLKRKEKKEKKDIEREETEQDEQESKSKCSFCTCKMGWSMFQESCKT